MTKRILVVEDQPDIQKLLLAGLEDAGFLVEICGEGDKGLEAALQFRPDLIVLDIMLPGLNGIELCKLIRAHPTLKHTAIIMLTAKGDESDIVYGFGLGANDYLVKPFRMKELIARIYARHQNARVLQSENASVPSNYGPLSLRPDQFQVFIGQDPISLTPAQFRLFETLYKEPGTVISRDRLLDAVAGDLKIIVDRNVDVHIRAIRRKLGIFGDIIQTIRGFGYRIASSHE